MSEAHKDNQILLLRQQVRVLQRKARQPKHFFRFEKTLLALLVAKMKQITGDFHAPLEPVSVSQSIGGLKKSAVNTELQR